MAIHESAENYLETILMLSKNGLLCVLLILQMNWTLKNPVSALQ